MANASLKAIVVMSLLLAGCACPHCARSSCTADEVVTGQADSVLHKLPTSTDHIIVFDRGDDLPAPGIAYCRFPDCERSLAIAIQVFRATLDTTGAVQASDDGV